MTMLDLIALGLLSLHAARGVPLYPAPISCSDADQSGCATLQACDSFPKPVLSPFLNTTAKCLFLSTASSSCANLSAESVGELTWLRSTPGSDCTLYSKPDCEGQTSPSPVLQDNWAQFVTSAGNSYASFKCLQLGKRDVLPKEEELIDPIGHITVNNVEYAVGFKRSIPIQAQNPESIEPTPSISDSINPVPTSGYTHLPLPPNRPTPCIPYTDKLGYIQDTTQSTHPEFSRCPGGPNKPAAVPAHTIIPIGPYNLNGTCPTPTKSIAASTAKAPTRPFDDSTSSDWDFEYQQEPEDKTPLGNGTAPVAFVNLTNPPTDDEKAGYEDDAVAIAYTSPN